MVEWSDEAREALAQTMRRGMAHPQSWEQLADRVFESMAPYIEAMVREARAEAYLAVAHELAYLTTNPTVDEILCLIRDRAEEVRRGE